MPINYQGERWKTFDLILKFQAFRKCLTKNAVLGRLPLGRGATAAAAAAAAANFRNDAKNRLRRRCCCCCCRLEKA